MRIHKLEQHDITQHGIDFKLNVCLFRGKTIYLKRFKNCQALFEVEKRGMYWESAHNNRYWLDETGFTLNDKQSHYVFTDHGLNKCKLYTFGLPSLNPLSWF